MAERVLRARLEAETSQFSVRMAAAQAQLARMERAPVAAARGMGQLQFGLRALAFQATGVRGPLGAVAASLGTLSLGSPVMLGVLAGVGAVGLAIKLLGRDADESKERIDKFLASLAEARLREALPAEALTRIVTRQSGLEARLAVVRAFEQEARIVSVERLKIEKELAELAMQRADVMKVITTDAVKQADASAKTAEAQVKANAAVERSFQNVLFLFANLRAQAEDYRREWEGWRFVDVLTGFGGFQPAAPRRPEMERSTIGLGRPPEFFIQQSFADTGPAKVLQEAIEAERPRLNLIDHLKTVIAQEGAATERAIVAQQLLAQATDATGRASEEAAARMIGAIGAMAAAMIRGPSVGSFLGFAGGIASLIPGGQIIGAGLMAAGGIASAIESRNRPQSVRVDSYGSQALSQMRREEREDRLISLTIVDSEGRTISQTRYELLRAERRDAVPRLPKGG